MYFAVNTLVTWCDLTTLSTRYSGNMSRLRTPQSSRIYLLFPIQPEKDMTTARIASLRTKEHIHNILEDIHFLRSDHVVCVKDLGPRR